MLFHQLLSNMIEKSGDAAKVVIGHTLLNNKSNEVKNSTYYHRGVGRSSIGGNSGGSPTARKRSARSAETTVMRRSFISLCNGMWIL